MNREEKIYKTDLKEDTLCPVTRRLLSITRPTFNYMCERYPYFGCRILYYYDVGERNHNVVFAKAMVDFLERYPELNNLYTAWMFTKFVVSFVRCEWGYAKDIPQLFNGLTDFGFLNEQIFKDTDPFFKEWLLIIKNEHNPLKYSGAVYAYNCYIISNIFTDFYHTEASWDATASSFLKTDLRWLVLWSLEIIKLLIIEGKIDLNKF